MPRIILLTGEGDFHLELEEGEATMPFEKAYEVSQEDLTEINRLMEVASEHLSAYRQALSKATQVPL